MYINYKMPLFRTRYTYYLIYSSYDTWKGRVIVLSWVSDLRLSLELFTASQYIDRIGRGNIIIGFSKSQTSLHITHDLTISFGMSDLKNHILTSDSSMGACVQSKPIPCKCQHSHRKNPAFITRNPVFITGILFSLCTGVSLTCPLFYPVQDCSADLD